MLRPLLAAGSCFALCLFGAWARAQGEPPPPVAAVAQPAAPPPPDGAVAPGQPTAPPPRAVLLVAGPQAPPVGPPLPIVQVAKKSDAPSDVGLLFDFHGRASALTLQGSDGGDHLYGLTVGQSFDTLVTAKGFSGRFNGSWAIGGGGGGVEGGLAQVIAMGARVSFDPHQGPFARAALDWRYQGNRKLLNSYIQLPQGQLGYQVLARDVIVEVAGTAAPVLAGRFKTGDDATRTTDGSLGWGGFATLQLRPLRLDATFLRVEARSAPQTPVDQVQGRLCGVAKVAILCGDLTWLHGDEQLADGTFRDTTALYAGVSLGVGVLASGLSNQLDRSVTWSRPPKD